MRKLILTPIRYVFLIAGGLVFLTTTDAHSQKIKIGARGGTSFANFYQHDIATTLEGMPIVIPGPGPFPVVVPYPEYETSFFGDMRVGLLSGLFIEWRLTERWNIESGINYVQKGINLSYNYNTTFVNNSSQEVVLSHHARRDLRMNYLTLPVVFKYKLDKKERLYVAAGIYHAIAISMKNKAAYNKTVLATGGLEEIFVSRSEKLYGKLFDAGFVAGWGVELPLKNQWTIGFDMRGNLGMFQVPQKYDKYGFAGFSELTRNVNIETSLSIARWLR